MSEQWVQPCGCKVLDGVPVPVCDWHRALINSLQSSPLTDAVLNDILCNEQSKTTIRKRRTAKAKRKLPPEQLEFDFDGKVCYISRGGHYG